MVFRTVLGVETNVDGKRRARSFHQPVMFQTYEAAAEEAAKQAEKHPNMEFYIMETTHRFHNSGLVVDKILNSPKAANDNFPVTADNELWRTEGRLTFDEHF